MFSIRGMQHRAWIEDARRAVRAPQRLGIRFVVGGVHQHCVSDLDAVAQAGSGVV